MHYPRVNLGNIIRENGAGFYIFTKISQGHSVMKKVFCTGWLKEQKDEFFKSTFFRGDFQTRGSIGRGLFNIEN